MDNFALQDYSIAVFNKKKQMHKKIALMAAIAAVIIPTTVTFAKGAGAQIQDGAGDMQRDRIQTQIGTPNDSETNPQFRQFRQENEQLNNKQQEINKIKDIFKQSKEKMTAERCKTAENRVSTRLNRYSNNDKMLETVYGNMTTRLDRLTAKLKTAGADTAQLEKDLATLKTKIADLKTAQTTFMATLNETQGFACGKSEGEFVGKLGEARKVDSTVKTARTAVKNFFQTTIKTDLAAIRATLKTAAAPTAKTTTTPEAITIQ